MESVKGKRKREIIEILIADMKALENDLRSARQTNASFALIYC
jgi:hypothetical protein